MKYDTFYEACVARGLVDSENAYDIAMSQAVEMGLTGGQLLSLYISLAVIGAPCLDKLYDKYEKEMAMGYIFKYVQNGSEMKIAEHKGALKLLCEVHERFKDNSIDTACLPEPDPVECKEYGLRFNETEYEKFSMLNDEKKEWDARFETYGWHVLQSKESSTQPVRRDREA